MSNDEQTTVLNEDTERYSPVTAPLLTVADLIAALSQLDDQAQPVRLPDGDREVVICAVHSAPSGAHGPILITRPTAPGDDDPLAVNLTIPQLTTLLRRWIAHYCGAGHRLLTAVDDELATDLISRAGTAQRGDLHVIVHSALRGLVGSRRLHRPDALRYALLGAASHGQ